MSQKVNVETDEGVRQIARPRVSRYYDWHEKNNDNDDDIKLITDLNTGTAISIPKLNDNTSNLDLNGHLRKASELDVN